MTGWIDAALGPYVGRRIHGGCDDCDAYREVDALAPAVWVIHVRHDEDCPTLARLKRRRTA